MRGADMFGDGLQHLVEIGTGRVRVWPNLGYGRFAPPVEIANPARLPARAVPADRIHLVDTERAAARRISWWSRRTDWSSIRTNAGNSFGSPRTVMLPAPFETIDAVTFGDVLGRGTMAAIVSLATGGRKRHFFFAISPTASVSR